MNELKIIKATFADTIRMDALEKDGKKYRVTGKRHHITLAHWPMGPDACSLTQEEFDAAGYVVVHRAPRNEPKET